VVDKVSTHRHGQECSIWRIPAVPPHVKEWYFYFLCISITEPKISNGLTNVSLHHELKKIKLNPETFKDEAQLHCLFPLHFRGTVTLSFPLHINHK